MRKLALFAAAALACVLSACSSPRETTPSISVMLAQSGGFTVAENPVSVAPGEDAVFHLTLEEGYTPIQSAPDAVWDAAASTLTVPAARYPSTTWLHAEKNPQKVRYFLELNGAGKMSSDVDQGLIYAGTTVNIHAEPREGAVFDGWSLGKPLKNGGKLLTDSPDYTYTVREDSFLYANFTSPVTSQPGSAPSNKHAGRETLLVVYDANGGVYAESGKNVHSVEVPIYHVYQNSLPDKNYFERDGYQLLGYSRSRDGMVDFITPGSKIVADKAEEPVLLYCVWAKENPESDFTWEENGSAVTLTGYTGSGDTLVIPDTLGGKKVTRVKSGAVQGDFTTLVLPEPIRTIDDGAFVTTPTFTTLYMRDTVTTMTDAAFTDLSGWQNLRLIASHTPGYTGGVAYHFGVKWERLVSAKRAGKKVLIVSAGSSVLYGLSSPQLEEILGGEYVVVNYGTYATTCNLFYLEMFSHFIGEGDIVVHAPELEPLTLGGNWLERQIVSHTEYAYNLWNYVDMRNYTNFFSSLVESNAKRKNAKKDYYQTSTKTVTPIGDRKNSEKMNKDNYHSGYDIKMDISLIEGADTDRLNAAYQRLLDTGARVYRSCAPMNRNAIRPEYLTREGQDAYLDSLRRDLIIPVISDIGEYVVEPRVMENSDYHVNGPGQREHTARLGKDILAQFERERSGQ